MIRLGVNVDHVATVRQARREHFPDPVRLAHAAVRAGAAGITAHLREDRRHIQDDDMRRLKAEIGVPLNMEMAAAPAMVAFAEGLRPDWACLVPERREELTTEGGLNPSAPGVADAVRRLKAAGVKVSLFVDPVPDAIRIAADLRADAVELHTGGYARAWAASPKQAERVTADIVAAARTARAAGLIVNAGHGLDYENVGALARRFPFHEFNIGFSIVARALETGMGEAVREMVSLLEKNLCAES